MASLTLAVLPYPDPSYMYLAAYEMAANTLSISPNQIELSVQRERENKV